MPRCKVDLGTTLDLMEEDSRKYSMDLTSADIQSRWGTCNHCVAPPQTRGALRREKEKGTA